MKIKIESHDANPALHQTGGVFSPTRLIIGLSHPHPGPNQALRVSARAQEYAGIPNTRISTQALSRVFQQLLIWKTLEYDVF